MQIFKSFIVNFSILTIHIFFRFQRQKGKPSKQPPGLLKETTITFKQAKRTSQQQPPMPSPSLQHKKSLVKPPKKDSPSKVMQPSVQLTWLSNETSPKSKSPLDGKRVIPESDDDDFVSPVTPPKKKQARPKRQSPIKPAKMVLVSNDL